MGYIPGTPAETQAMLEALGMASAEELYADVPEGVRLRRGLALGAGESEAAVIKDIRRMAAKNTVYEDIFMGAGAYRHFIPAAVENIAARNEFVTAYTPYQAEMSQGILQGIFEYQTMICELTGMDASNASVYDGATAAGEACIMARARNRNKILVAATANPQVADVMKTYAAPLGMTVEAVPENGGQADMQALAAALDDHVAAVYIASPNYYGILEDIEKAAALAHGAGAKLIAGVHPIAAALFKTPGELGADIAVGEGQPLGLPLAYGGPYLGFMACKQPLMRKLPGRIVGETEDGGGRRAFVLTLQAREQHIRREKAGSNICSNQAWCALRAAAYMSVMGRAGMETAARQCYANAHYLRDQLSKIGFAPVYEQEFFNEFLTDCPVDAAALQRALDKRGILGGLPIAGGGRMLWCATELNGRETIDNLIDAVQQITY